MLLLSVSHNQAAASPDRPTRNRTRILTGAATSIREIRAIGNKLVIAVATLIRVVKPNWVGVSARYRNRKGITPRRSPADKMRAIAGAWPVMLAKGVANPDGCRPTIPNIAINTPNRRMEKSLIAFDEASAERESRKRLMISIRSISAQPVSKVRGFSARTVRIERPVIPKLAIHEEGVRNCSFRAGDVSRTLGKKQANPTANIQLGVSTTNA